MECDLNLNGFQSIRCVNGHVDILYSYDVSFAVQYSWDFCFYICQVKCTFESVHGYEQPYVTKLPIHYSKILKEHVDIMIFIERYPLKRCQGCVKLIASKVNCFLNITDLSEVQLCMSSSSWT